MKRETALNFTEGPVFAPLLKFALPVLGAQFLQALYGGVDLLIVGQFASTADVSGVATGSQIMQTLTNVIVGLSMGVTILTAQKIGERDKEGAGCTVGCGIVFFLVIGVVWTLLMIALAAPITCLMRAPPEAFQQTLDYVRICGSGAVFITAYNLLGSIFRGMGDSRIPLITVAFSAAFNVAGDLFFVRVLGMGAAGAAWATIISQGMSVVFSLAIIRHRTLPFTIKRSSLRLKGSLVGGILKMGAPLALQDLLVGISFLVIIGIVNSLGVVKSAGLGVAEKVCSFIMLAPSSFSQSVSTFVAQNYGAHKMERARRALLYGILTSVSVGIFIGAFAFFRGDILTSIFSTDPDVIREGHDYLKAYAFDTVFTSFMFCFVGYFNGTGRTLFTMIQGIAGAFGVRIPVSYFVAHILHDTSLFHIGLATPSSTLMQIILCLIAFPYYERKMK